MTIACAHCNAALPEAAEFCPACGQPSAEKAVPLGKTGGIDDRLAGAMAYLTIIPAIIFLLMSPFCRNRFIRFHSLQCLFLFVSGLALASFVLLLLIRLLGPLIAILLAAILALAWGLLWLVLLVKALQGEMFKIPWFGDWAERQAGRA